MVSRLIGRPVSFGSIYFKRLFRIYREHAEFENTKKLHKNSNKDRERETRDTILQLDI